MKIKFLKLKNFSNIYTSFKSKEIEIDFSESKNKVILFTGPNGSGKTSILSCLHPFANNGNLDIRNDNPLVLIGKEGYKEIIIEDGYDEYIIKHYYTPSKESHTVKSYIQKNEIELNPNGNVTSFKEIVKDELDIEQDYLKLTRLGSNVTNFIDLKTTERKAFMGKILDEVEIYLKYFKKLSSDMRELKSIISHIVDKITKLSISDIEEIEKIQKQLKKNIKKVSDSIAVVNNALSIINYEIEKYESPLVINEKLSLKEKEFEKILKNLKKKDGNIDIEECINSISSLEIELNGLELSLSSLIEKRENKLNQLDKMISEKEDVDKELKKIDDSIEIRDTEYMINELRNTIENRSKENSLIDYHPKVSKTELEELIVMLDKCMDILYTTYEFGKEPIKKAITYISNKEDISLYVENHNNKISHNKLQVMAEFVYNELTKKHGNIKPGCSSYGNCKVMELYDDLYDLATEIPDAVVEDEVFVTYTKMANQNINTVIKKINSFKDTFKKLPENIQNMFKLGDILDKIQKLECIYDKSILYSELTRVTEYELQQHDLEELSKLKEKLSLLKKSISNVDFFEKKSKTLIDDIEECKETIDSLYIEINDIKNKIVLKKDLISDLEEIKTSIETRDIVEEEFKELKKSYETIKDLNVQKKEKLCELDNLTFELNKYTKEFNDNDYRIQSYYSLSSELESYRKTYDEMELVKNSLSSKEGIPLLYIQVYLKNIQEVTNELLEIIYDDELTIDKFFITADEFKIPYIKGGTQIKDVCYASQGERSFISLALSFALIYQSISKYNIMLLDEIDSTLDTSNREKFLQILEKQMDMIDTEQLFLISHNNMFNMYPVDIIDTKNHVSNENKLANYIKIKIK